jgi:TonB-linked SusC/RagA family outer membrane protein
MKKRCTHTLFKTLFRPARARGFKIWALFLLINLFTLPLLAQVRKITGIVKDNKNQTLPGVTVKVKGAQQGTATDLNGKYTLNITDGKAVLVFTYVGYVTKEVPVANGIFDVILSEVSNELNEVVVMGYGETIRKRDLTGSISSIGAKQITERQPTNLVEALQGQIAGALVVTDNGDPNGTGTVQIRGASSVNGGVGPLYVIDGVISDNANFLNPTDIASIEVLKDASSAAIYGARGANGVILVTTKRGKEGQSTVNGSYYINFGNLAHKIATASASQLRFYRAYRDGTNGTNTDSVNTYLNADNDYQDLLFKTGIKQVGSLNFSGGQKGLTYYGGVSYTDDKSILINSYAKKIQSKLNINYQSSEKFKIFNSVSFAYQTGNTVPLSQTLRQVFERNPWTSIYRPDGTYAGYVESKRNPVAQALFTTNVDKNYTAQNSTQLTYLFNKDLQVTGLFNAQLDNLNNVQLTPSSLTNGGTGLATGKNALKNQFYYETQVFANYNHVFATNHTVTAMLGTSLDSRRDDAYNIGLQNYVSESILNPSAATYTPTTSSYPSTAHSDQSIFARLGYNYKSRYLLQGTFRRDGSSRFGLDNQYGNFYSGSVGWRFSDEKFMKWAGNVLYDGKLRFSLGQTGNDQIGDYNSYTTFVFGDYYNGVQTASANQLLGNPNIKWETTTTKNWGTDLSFFKGRMTFTGEYYIKTTSGLLYSAPLPAETGATGFTVNLGNIQNTGLEFTLGGTPVQSQNVSWTIQGNISFQKGKILELANHTSFVSNNKWIIREGGKIGDFYLWKNLGVYPYDVSNAYSASGQLLTPVGISNNGTVASGYTLNGQPYTGSVKQLSRNGITLQGGDTMWQDVNNDGVIDDQDKQIVGNGLPDYYFGITNTITFKGFSLNFLFNGQIGNKVYNTTANYQNNSANSSTSPPTVDAILTSWRQQGDISKYPLATRKDSRGSISYGYNSLYLEDGSFIRLSSARLNYAFDKKLAAKIKLRGLSMYVYGSNLLTFTKYSWFDPEFTSTNVLNPGEDLGRYPKRREFGFGINLTL